MANKGDGTAAETMPSPSEQEIGTVVENRLRQSGNKQSSESRRRLLRQLLRRVKSWSLAIKSPGRDDILLQITENGKVNNNIVSAFQVSNTLTQFRKLESESHFFMKCLKRPPHYACLLEVLIQLGQRVITPRLFSNYFLLMSSELVDDDKKCYLGINYTFDIRKDWQQTFSRKIIPEPQDDTQKKLENECIRE
ncbi:hypothetical protein Cgig2_003494 [Carnegiea gigantea]|uniref:Uncharacterized protein n=1 Tax=Carnegiea gigantea TaxID=171969 RepID=A0A9Q1KC16_9CARY|nr:hypothetical protein Cgig2_003494 [Carnegiea gigantea]